MTTVLRVHGLRIVIYSNDHAPPHCHVIGPGCEAKVALGNDLEGPRIVTNEGLSRSQLTKALATIAEHRLLLLEHWWILHGDD